MAQRSGLFDSTEIVETIDGYPRGNRAETADFFAKYFSNFIGNGVFMEASTSFQVTTAGGMKVTVKKGSCFINGYMAFDDEDEMFTLTAGHTHWLVQRAHIISGGDITKTWIVDATEGELPLRDGAYYDLLIAKVVIPSGATAITDYMITDYRYDETVCGAVTSLKPSVVPTLPDDVLKYVGDGLFRTAGGTSVDIGNAKAETGSYIGTGTPPTLTFSITPKMVFIMGDEYDETLSSPYAIYHRTYFAILHSTGLSYISAFYPSIISDHKGMYKSHGLRYDNVSFNENVVTWNHSDNILTFYIVESGMTFNASFMNLTNIASYSDVMNFFKGCKSGVTYHYVAIA